ncbi:hypothetical protein Nepgr_016262 [Nepenthes gracilis]|uniref:Ubiquitin thioesterase OTU n=1 Tax=Nepenthes gracilis TaxID=150966 RepID=A0AAD3SQ63_NEPGR|nr:hypothetical protein Nepgr_016262 [Nepenthes gracilis]
MGKSLTAERWVPAPDSVGLNRFILQQRIIVVGSFAGSSIFPFAFLVDSFLLVQVLTVVINPRIFYFQRCTPLSNMEGVVVRRVIPSDNSCLFNAVGYVMDHDKNKATALREVIAATVSSDPVKYSEAFLGKPNEEYCSWILNSEKWGGAIELSILADYYAREIAAYDIQTSRCDLYGQDRNFSERVMLIYDGLHYDALAMSPSEGAPEDFDETIFTIRGNRTIGPVEGLALSFVKEQQRLRKYTDTANFTLRCGICQRGVKGEKEAVEHAQATGHVNFQEYR